MVGLFYTHQSVALTLASDMEILYRNSAFSILVFSTKKRSFSFLKKVFVFQKICFKVKVLTLFRISTDCHIKTWRSYKRRAILKIPSTVFRRIYVLSVGFKIKPLRKTILQFQDKNQPKFCRKTCWKEQPFFFTVYFMNHIFQTFVYVIIECIELNWLCKHMKKVRSSQVVILAMNWE